jgi:hypothetical protein
MAQRGELASAEGNETGYPPAWVEWDDGMRRPLLEEMLDNRKCRDRDPPARVTTNPTC